METITAYKTSDGRIFEDEIEAKAHELLIETEEWYQENPLFDNDNIIVDFERVYGWILSNKKELKKYLKI